MEFNIKLDKGKVLKGIIHSPGEGIQAVVILIHGIGEHVRRYSVLAEVLKKENIALAGVDLPGHGLSDGKRGRIKNFAALDEIFEILLKTANRTFPGVPVYIYGHSLGAGIVLNYLLRKNPKINGAIVTSPWLRLSFETNKLAQFFVSFMKYIIPGLVVPTGLNIQHISHDEEVIDRYKNDPLVHNKISLGLFDSAMKSGEASIRNAAELKIPILLMHGTDDMICSFNASREFSEKTRMAELKAWEGGYHELHNELFKEEVFGYIVNWIKRRKPAFSKI